MDENLRAETERLIRSWERHEPEFLNDYLISSVEDPRRNLQSVLTRHFLITALFGDRFAELMEQEILFASAFDWLISLGKLETEERAAILHALVEGCDNAEGRSLPRFVIELFKALPVSVDGGTIPNYFARALESDEPSKTHAADTFLLLWSNILGSFQMPAPKPTVLEIACGSANDYRFLHRYGVARFFDYSGVDLSPKNIANARTAFPQVDFSVGNVFALGFADLHFDYVLAQDLFEHLSPEGLEQALTESCRVTRRSLVLGFFNMDEIAEHEINPIEDYHWNRLSLPRVKEGLARRGFNTQAFHLDTYLRWLLPGRCTHNPYAYTLIATRKNP